MRVLDQPAARTESEHVTPYSVVMALRPPCERTDPAFLAACRGDAPCDLALTSGRVLDVFRRTITDAEVGIFRGRIARLRTPDQPPIDAGERFDCSERVLVPGFIDAHMHVESTMLPPTRFAVLASPHGTTGAVFDPHEIANVLGEDGIRWVMADAANAPIDASFGLSSCVPSSPLENAGAELDADALAHLFEDRELGHRLVTLAEMMNFPGVVHADPQVLAKVRLGLERGHGLVDGHAPGLRGTALQAYAGAGITSDHECTTAEEAAEKLSLGMRIFIREGSAARNLDALLPLVGDGNAHRFCFCTDDRHPGDLRRDGHIDNVVRRAIAAGLRPETAIAIGSLHTAEHFGLADQGAIAPGRHANIVALVDIDSIEIDRVWWRGGLVAEDGEARFTPPDLPPLASSVVCLPGGFAPSMLRVEAPLGATHIRVVGMHPDQLVTDNLEEAALVERGLAIADPSRDLLKLAVIERHLGTGNVGLGFVRGFRFSGGAIASTVGHDAHNLTVVGDSDEDMALAARTLADVGGGQCVVSGGSVVAILPLPIAGLMSDRPASEVIRQQSDLLVATREKLGCPHDDPFMPLSFLSLPVIPHLKLTDLGVIDVDRFKPVPLWIEA